MDFEFANYFQNAATGSAEPNYEVNSRASQPPPADRRLPIKDLRVARWAPSMSGGELANYVIGAPKIPLGVYKGGPCAPHYFSQ